MAAAEVVDQLGNVSPWNAGKLTGMRLAEHSRSHYKMHLLYLQYMEVESILSSIPDHDMDESRIR